MQVKTKNGCKVSVKEITEIQNQFNTNATLKKMAYSPNVSVTVGNKVFKGFYNAAPYKCFTIEKVVEAAAETKEETTSATDLLKLKKDELIEIATKKGIELDSSETKKDLVAKIVAAGK